MGLIGWLVSIGCLLLGVAVGVWSLTDVSKSIAVWCVGIPGAICLVFALGFELQNFAYKKTIVATDRPWIGIDRIDLEPLVIGSSLRAAVYFVNSGNRPALNTRAHVQATTVPRGGQAPPPLTSLPLPDNPTAVIMPNGSLRIFAFAADQFALRTQGDVDLIKNGSLTPWITARVEYSDSTGGSYYTMFRGVLDQNVGTYVVANPGNEAK